MTNDRKDEFSPELEYLKIQDSIRRRKTVRILLFSFAALLPLALSVGLFIYTDNNLTGGKLTSKVSTVSKFVPNGDRQTFVFQDGTSVIVNAGSRISFPDRFGLTMRELSLDGEAYFEVAHNPRRPFLVHIGDETIKVLGTSFNVRAFSGEEDVEVALDKGKVDVLAGSRHYVLAPGQVLKYDRPAGVGAVQTCNTSMFSEWTKNTVSFKSADIDEIATNLSRLFGVHIYINPSVDRSRLYTFTTKRTDLDLILSELEIIAPISATRDGDTILIRNK